MVPLVCLVVHAPSRSCASVRRVARQGRQQRDGLVGLMALAKVRASGSGRGMWCCGSKARLTRQQGEAKTSVKLASHGVAAQ